MAEPSRARAILSNKDFGLLRQAVVHYLRFIQGALESKKFARLYHCLGSAAPK
jgi:hypothetical protein